jgi:hypothetical protein
MADTLFGLGIFAIIAAIVGGGLKAFGFELGAFASIRRQILLGFFGIFLIVATNWSTVNKLLFPVHFITDQKEKIDIGPGETRYFSFDLGQSGPVDVQMQQIIPDWSGRDTQTGTPELLMKICSTDEINSCPQAQIAASASRRRELHSGPAEISIFNFDTSPPLTFWLSIKYPK